MAVRKTGSSVDNIATNSRAQNRLRRAMRQKRRSLLETLEARQLLTTGPMLVGIQPDDAGLLDNAQILNTSPRELTFRFDEATSIDPSTLEGIRIVRAGPDGSFESAGAVSDLGSNGAARIEFEAVTPGASGNGLTVVFTKATRDDTSLPIVSVVNNQIIIELNDNPARVTRAQDIQFGINGTAAQSLIRVASVEGQPFFPVGQSAADGLTLVLSGADTAQAVSSLGAPNVQVRFTAQASGDAGQALSVVIREAPLAFGATPSVRVLGSQVEVLINSTVGSRTTVGQFVDAINNNPSASLLLSANLDSGDPTLAVGLNLDLISPIPFNNTGSFDVVVEPGFVGLGDSTREVVFRFAEDLPQDQYRIEIDGSSSSALRALNGEAFNGGVDQTILFDLNLAPTILGVVPQPIISQNGSQVQLTNQVWVYFDSNDPLDVSVARNTALYQLHATRNTETNADDAIFTPTNVTYNPGTGVAVLEFATDLHVLAQGTTAENFRLRIGATDTGAFPPVSIPTTIEPGDSFAGARDVTGNWNPSSTNVTSVVIDGAIAKEETIGGFVISNNEYLVDFPGSSEIVGNREIRSEDPSRLQRPVPLDHLRGGADAIDGVTSVFYNFFGQYEGDDPTTFGIDNDRTYFNVISEQQKERVREALDLYSQYLGIQFIESEAMGIQIAVGDVVGANANAVSGQGGVRFASNSRLIDADDVLNGTQFQTLVDLQVQQEADAVLTGIRAQPLGVLDLQDFDESDDDLFGSEFFQSAMGLLGQMFGYGVSDELSGTVITSQPANPANLIDVTYPGPADIIHGQYLFRPDSTDIDLYRFTLPNSGSITVETVAERLSNTSQLDTHLRLYREAIDGSIVEVAANDDYWSEDSQIELEVSAGTYYIGVSASGNDVYNPLIEDTGIGGRSEGIYELRMSFEPLAGATIIDETGIALDGDSDGNPGGHFDFWFDTAATSRTIFVDKDPGATVGAIGSLTNPYRDIDTALARADAGGIDIVRILPSDGADQNLATVADNQAYQIGFSELGSPLADGSSFQVPQDVTVMIDAGAIFKLRRARIAVGSSSPVIDLSGGSLQVLGTPVLVGAGGAQLTAEPQSGEVTFTSLADSSIGGIQSGNLPQSGDWGGIDFRSDIDKTDENRTNLEAEGIFLNHVQHATLNYGGGVVSVEGRSNVISPIELSNSRATVAHTTILNSADSAIEATPDSFEESKFSGHDGQAAGDYSRIGPDIHDVILDGNSINGLFIRTETLDGSGLQSLTTLARFNDLDIVHVLTENLEIQGTPGGGIVETQGPPALLVRLSAQAGGNLAPGAYAYKLTNVDANGNESPASDTTNIVFLQSGDGSIRLEQLPGVPAGGDFVARRLYRAPITFDPVSNTAVEGTFRLVQAINGSSSEFTDIGFPEGAVLDAPVGNIRARLDARLAIDPGIVVKVSGAAIEVQQGAQLLAEGNENQDIIITSLDDRRYGRGGNFNTNEAPLTQGFQSGDWGGIYIGPGAHASLDHVRLVGGGGAARIEGQLAGFNPIEVHQGELRLTNSRIEESGTGLSEIGGTRGGRGAHFDGVLFARGTQPIIADNVFINNDAAPLNFDLNSFNNDYVVDTGRSTSGLGRIDNSLDNQGPLISGNVVENNATNGLEIRGGELTVAGVWDDTDIVHVVRQTITIPNQHVFGGLRLESSASQSLIVKLESSETDTAAIVAGGDLDSAVGEFLDITDRIGGAFQIVGQPGQPVVLTSVNDDTIGAGFDTQGRPQNDTNNSRQLDLNSTVASLPTGPEVANGTIIDNDVAVDVAGHFSFGPVAGGGVGATAGGGTNEVTTQGVNTFFQQQNALFDYLNYIDVGADGAAVDLGTTNITTAPTLLSDDVVFSEGDFPGENGTVNWRVEQSLQNGSPRLITELTLTSDAPIGDLRFINYYDPLIASDAGDLLFTEGLPGTNDFRVTVLDGPERVGFRHFGTFEQGTEGLSGAAYEGWIADEFPDLITAPEFNLQFQPDGTIDQTSIPLTTVADLPAPVYGPAIATTAHAWLVNPTATSVTITAVLELIEDEFDETVGLGTPGDWEGLVVREAAHDRNYDVAVESEGDLALNRNDSPTQAQFVGAIAPSEKAASENRRLGVTVLGTIQDASDVDVYSFEAEAGTEIWLDIDRTNSALDSVVELLDSEGNVLALSDGSVAEELQPGLLVRDNVIGSTELNPLSNSFFNATSTSAFDTPQDLYSTNPRDAGLRVVLPGELGESFTYQVRVRSSNVGPGETAARLLDNSLLFDGITAGAYELSIRLNEIDETPGTFFNLADIRFAQTGITVIGQPLHSPLLGEEAESDLPNDTRAQAQTLSPYSLAGDALATVGLLQSDTGAQNVSGTISSLTDIDWYQIDIQYQQITRDGLQHFLSTTFDIDYADGLARPDLSIWVYNNAGQLILTGLDSNVAEDQPGDPGSTDTSDLSRGSTGNLDPFIGNAELPEGTYFVAVSGRDNIPTALNQFNGAAAVNPLIRLEPPESIERIVEDHVGTSGGGTFLPPEQNVLFNAADAAVNYTLNDVPFYVSTGGLTNNILLANSYTGQSYGAIGSTNTQAFGDIAVRNNGDIGGYNINGVTNDNSWHYYNINSGTAQLTDLTPGGTGLTTQETRVTVNPMTGVQTLTVAQSNNGVTVNAFTLDDELGFIVGNRSTAPVGVDFSSNILWSVNPATGRPQGSGGFATAPTSGAATSPRERGHIETSPLVPTTANRIGITAASVVDSSGQLVPSLVDGLSFTVRDFVGPNSVSFELDLGTAIELSSDIANGIFVRDGETITVGTQVFELDAGTRFQLTGSEDISLGGVHEGTQVRITDRHDVVHVFEFDSDTLLADPANIPVSLLGSTTDAGAANLLALAINSVPDFEVRATPTIDGEVVLSGDSTTTPVVTGLGIAPIGQAGTSIQDAIRIDEDFSATEIARAIANAMQESGIAVSQAGTRIRFVNDPTVSLLLDTPIGGTPSIAIVGTAGLNSALAREIDFDVNASVSEIGQLIADAINAAEAAGLLSNVTAVVSGNSVLLGAAEVTTAGGPLTLGGVAPGGTVTGIAIINGGNLYAVSNAGGLYSVNAAVVNSTNGVFGEVGTYVASATDLLGIPFTGLASGPDNVENGRYANLLFGIDILGNVHAFNTAGELQPVFAGGASSISTGIVGATGLDFSNLDYNLWHVTGTRALDPGHGINATFNGTRPASVGGGSWYFGYDAFSPGVVGVPTAPRAVQGPVLNTYDFAGGAHGEIISEPFSLEGYSPEDLPTFYYTYFLASDAATDALRLYVIDEDGREHSISTNSSVRGVTIADDEYDDPTPFLSDFYDDDIVVETQELFDNTNTWRQARVPLDPFAGQSNLRFRFEFSTAGSIEFGEVASTSSAASASRIQAVSGDQVSDGDRFTVNGRDFEFVLPPALTIPAGSGINDGDSISLDGVTYQFALDPTSVAAPNVAVPFTLTDTAEQVAESLQTVIANLQITLTEQLDVDNTDASQVNDTIPTASPVSLLGPDVVVNSTGSIGTPNGSVLSVDVDMLELRMTAGQVVNITVAETAAAPGLNPVARLFNDQGQEIFRSLSNINSETIVPFQAPADGTFYLAISGEGNDAYDPFSTTVGRNFGASGSYALTIEATRAYDIRAISDRVVLNGTGDITISTGSNIEIEGGDGSIGIPVIISRDMTSEEVATIVADAVRETIGNSRVESVTQNGATLFLPGMAVTEFGPLQPTLRSGDSFATPTRTMAVNNQNEGVYLDDFIIGFRERGELVTGAVVDDTFTADQGLTRTLPNLPAQSIASGSYQLEIRDSSEYVQSIDNTLFSTFNTNDRLSQAVTLQTVSAAELRGELNLLRSTDPEARLTFELNDGQTTITFEFVDLTTGETALPGNVEIGFNPGVINPVSGQATAEPSEVIAGRILAAINTPVVQSLLEINAISSSGLQAEEAVQRRDDRINLSGNVNIDAGTSVNVLNIEIFDHRGDENRERDAQGVVRIDGAQVSFSAGYGIVLDHGPGENLNNVVRYPRALVETNTENLTPGVLVQNNVLAFNGLGGINVIGLGNEASSSTPIAFDRIVNNTIVGGAITTTGVSSPLEFEGTVFETGAIAFADAIADYQPSTTLPPAPALQVSASATGAPDYVSLIEPLPAGGEGVVSLGGGGSITVQFVDNRLVGNGDASPDLQIFEGGASEPVAVEVSIDGTTFTSVGTAVGGNNRIDIDRFGFGPNDVISFVRLTDLNFGDPLDLAIGADIDAVGAISSIPADQFSPAGIGINLESGVSPTLLNNVFVNNDIAVQADADSGTAVLAGNTYQANTLEVSGLASVGALPRIVDPLGNLFVSGSEGIFIPTQGSDLIDSSIDSLDDRSTLLSVKEPLGLLESPILAPDLDANGSLRVDDPTQEVPGGQGQTIFKDRGAFDRGDQAGPRGIVISPLDNARDNSDFDPRVDALQVFSSNLEFFEILLVDGGEPANPQGGVGINDRTVTSDALLLFENNVALIEGEDYVFGYDTSGNVIRLTPLAGLWNEDSTYQIRLLNDSQTVLVASPSQTYLDGEQISVIDATGSTTVFEIERGIVVTVPALPGDVANAADGQTFVIFDGVTERRFEFESSGGVLANNFPIQFPIDPVTQLPLQPSVSELSAAIRTAIIASGLNVQVSDLGGSIQIFANDSLASVTPETALLTVQGETGVSQGFGLQVPQLAGVPNGIVDGQTFTVRRGDGRIRTFEFDTNNSLTNPQALAVSISQTSSLAQVTQAIANAIAVSALDLNPQIGSAGQVLLPEAGDVTLDLSATSLIQVGQPGDEATTAIRLEGVLTAAEVAVALTSSLEAANLPGISLSTIGDRIIVQGAQALTGVGASRVQPIADNAGNSLSSNDALTGTTQFTIFLSAGSDFADAPSPYQSLLSDNGARHEVVAGFSLGSTATPETDARVPDGDIDDGVAITSLVTSSFGTTAAIELNNTAGLNAVLDAWIDWNQDGQFGLDERVFAGQSLINGVNNLSFLVPATALQGDTFGRFRLTSTGIDSPIGPASDGEVEDIQVTVQNSPYQNPSNRYDVNDSGNVSPIDVLQILNALRNAGTNSISLQFPAPAGSVPPYLDVNGDGTVQPLDALQILNFINQSSALGEGEGEAVQWVPASNGVLTPTAFVKEDRDEGALTQELTPSPEQVSVFDSSAQVALDSVIEDLANDREEDEDASELDDFFANLSFE